MLELRNFKLSVKSKATGTPQGVYYIYALGVAMRSLRVAQQVVLYIYIGVGLSALYIERRYFLFCYLLDYQQVQENSNVSIILLGDKKEPTK